MYSGIRSGLYYRRQRTAMGRIQARRLTRRATVDQARRTMHVELQHPVADDLQFDAADLRRAGARCPFIYGGQRLQPAHLTAILARTRSLAHARRVEIGPEGNGHGEAPLGSPPLESDASRVGGSPL